MADQRPSKGGRDSMYSFGWMRYVPYNDSVTFLHVIISPKRFILNHVKVHADHYIINGADHFIPTLLA